MTQPIKPREQQTLERIQEYQQFGEQHTYEQRIKAGEAAIAILFCTDWSNPRYTCYLSPALERLEAFAGNDAWLEAAHRVQILKFNDNPDREALEQGIQSLHQAFNLQNSPQPWRWWREVIRQARATSGRSEK
jgi:hypothetical protein